MKIGVFDSGIGGKIVGIELQKVFQNANIIVVDDKQNIPYGDKTPQQIIDFTTAAIQPLINNQCDVIVIACNTATAVAIDHLRLSYPKQKFIGLEPMIKTAASLTKTNTFAVFATPRTLESERYKTLLHKYANGLKVIQPDCSKWAYMIENNIVNRSLIAEIVRNVSHQNCDVIVLGCTHYHWIKSMIKNFTNGKVTVIEPSEAIAKRVKQLLELS